MPTKTRPVIGVIGNAYRIENRFSVQAVGENNLRAVAEVANALPMMFAGTPDITDIGQVLDLVSAAPANWFELTLHQHMPMFHMEHCVFCTFLSKGTTYKDCGRPCESHVVHLRDRVGQMHRLMADVGCRNTLFNAVDRKSTRLSSHSVTSRMPSSA